MLDLGDVLPLSWTVRDSAGSPVDAGAVTVTVTDPDGSATSPAVGHVAASGVYTASFVTAMAGRHSIRWLATGANAQAYTDVFWVADVDSGMLISLAEARLAMRFLPGQVVDDEDLRALVVAATPIMEDVCGAILPRTCDEWHDGGGVLIALDSSPLVSVTSVSESSGNVRHVLAEQPLDGATFDVYGFTVDLDLGTLTRRSSGAPTPFALGRSNVHVVYRAGRARLPANIVRATRRLVQWLWQTEINGVKPAGPALVSTPAGFAVPRAVVDMCGTEARIRAVTG